MTDCRQTGERLTSYVDDALPADERTQIEAHLDRCPPCRHAADVERGARTILRARGRRMAADQVPAGLRRRCESLARAHAAPPESRSWMSWLVPVSLTSVLIVFTGLALFSLATQRSNTLLAAQLTADHSKCFRLFAPPNAATADARLLEQQLADQHGWDIHIPPSSPEDGVQLIGARRCLYADGRVPHVLYRVNGQDVSLYMLEGVNRDQADLVTLGHRSRIWSRGATTYVLVSPEDSHDMARAVRYVMQEAH